MMRAEVWKPTGRSGRRTGARTLHARSALYTNCVWWAGRQSVMDRRPRLVSLTCILLTAAAPRLATARSAQAGTRAELRVVDLDGRRIDPFAAAPAIRANAFVFTTTDCPISNRYAPEIRRLLRRVLETGHPLLAGLRQSARGRDAVREHAQTFALRAQRRSRSATRPREPARRDRHAGSRDRRPARRRRCIAVASTIATPTSASIGRWPRDTNSRMR